MSVTRTMESFSQRKIEGQVQMERVAIAGLEFERKIEGRFANYPSNSLSEFIAPRNNNLLASVSIPLRIHVTDPSEKHPDNAHNVDRMNRAHVSANKQIDQMYDVIHNLHLPGNQALVHAAFGHDANIQQIKNNIHSLKHGTINIARLHNPLIPENLRGEQAAPLAGHAWHNDFKTLRRDHSPHMHKIADSYAKFGEVEAARQHHSAATAHHDAQAVHNKEASLHISLAQANPGAAHFHNDAAWKHRVQADAHGARSNFHLVQANLHRYDPHKASIASGHHSSQAAKQSFTQAQATMSHMQAAHLHYDASNAHHNAAKAHGVLHQQTGHPGAAQHQILHGQAAHYHHSSSVNHIQLALNHSPAHGPHSNDAHSVHNGNQSAAHANQSILNAHKAARKAVDSAQAARNAHHPRRH
ncbi:hypothetical protein M413DRAFT_428494 [Hebeloma cylindrosporum]|uniref:Uncharacterized protein n=1 Tax=Hebeloma cylindrosporum TaxID=76867 RepID=A0A0C2Y3L0_HEBCY|nr:hypothetical protein M413DRAFT_428494 [Hebeloma cylindrosporum h7]